MKAGRLTCHALVQQYLARIDAYDKKGPAINAIVVVNPAALQEADELDRRYKASGPVGPLHCIPLIVKDNFETIGLQSADGSLSLKGFVSNRDAFQVKRIKEAGRDRAREVEHGGVRVQPVRNGELDPARLHEESVRARPRDGRVERRHGRGGRGQLRRPSGSAATPATRFAARRRTRRSSAFARRWG